MRIHADFVSFNEMVSFAKQLVELTEKKKAEGAAQPAACSQSQAAQKLKEADQPQPVHTTAPVQQTLPAQPVPTTAPQPPAASQVQTTAAVASAMPQAPVPVSTAAPQAPVQPVPPTVPTGAKEYTMDELAVAAIPLMDAGAGGQQMLIDLLHQFGTDALPNLPKSQYGAFATALRGLGAKI